MEIQMVPMPQLKCHAHQLLSESEVSMFNLLHSNINQDLVKYFRNQGT